jgi:hypothetical protein
MDFSPIQLRGSSASRAWEQDGRAGRAACRSGATDRSGGRAGVNGRVCDREGMDCPQKAPRFGLSQSSAAVKNGTRRERRDIGSGRTRLHTRSPCQDRPTDRACATAGTSRARRHSLHSDPSRRHPPQCAASRPPPQAACGCVRPPSGQGHLGTARRHAALSGVGCAPTHPPLPAHGAAYGARRYAHRWRVQCQMQSSAIRVSVAGRRGRGMGAL